MADNPNNANLNPEASQVTRLSRNQLVDRDEQLSKFVDVLDRIGRQGTVSSNLFEYYGSPGIGKSVLVGMLADEANKRHAAWTIIDFKISEEKTEAYFRDPGILIEEIVSGLKRQVNLDTHELDIALGEYRKTVLPDSGVTPAYAAMDQETRLYRRPDWLTELRNAVVAFIKLVNILPSYEKTNGIRPVVLFFDETEHAEIELVDWIEEWIINPLIQIKHCVVIWTARRPWRWKRPEIRRRLTSELLKVFEPDTVKEQIKLGSEKPDLVLELFQNVYTLTGGHPFANHIVIEKLDLLAEKGEDITPKTFQDFESQLLKEVFDRFINGYAFGELEPNDVKIACKFISLVRSFDSTMLSKILQACVGNLFTSWTSNDFGELLLKLKKTQLLVWEKGYAIDPGLRHIIQKYYMVLDRDTFIRANKAALDVYKDWLKRPVDNRSLFVLEELYHHAALMQVGQDANLQELLAKRLAEYPERIRDKQALDNALERLEGEIQNDKELEQFTLSNTELVKQVQGFRDAINLS